MDGQDDSRPVGGDIPSTLPSLPAAASETVDNPASVRSIAVAKLRRAASLPRQKDGRRPASPATPRPPVADPASSDSHDSPLQGDESEPSISRGRLDWAEDADQEDGRRREAVERFLDSPSPSPARFLQRSASVSTQNPSEHLAKFHPLPTLQVIQSRHLLQRSNSAAARTEAMAKLTGEPVPRKPPSPQPSSKPAPPIAPSSDDPPSAPARPRLGRSFTISTGASGERRSVVGRRMMARLGNRAANGASPSPSPTPTPQAQSGRTSPTQHESTEAAASASQEAIVPIVSGSNQDLPSANTFGRPTTSSQSQTHGPDSNVINLDEEETPPRLQAQPHLLTTPATPSHPRPLTDSNDTPAARFSVDSASTNGTRSTQEHGLLGTDGEHTDSFEFSDLLRRTNSGRTARSITPHPTSSIGSADFNDSQYPPIPTLSVPLSALSRETFEESPPRLQTARYSTDSPGSNSNSVPSIPILPPSADSTHLFFPQGLNQPEERLRLASGSSFPASLASGDVLRPNEPMPPLGANATAQESSPARARAESTIDDEDSTPLVSQGAFPPRMSPSLSTDSSQATPLGRSPAVPQDSQFASTDEPWVEGHASQSSSRESILTLGEPSSTPSSSGLPSSGNLEHYADSKLTPFPGLEAGGRSRGGSVGSLSPSVAPLASGPNYFDVSASRSSSPEASTGKKSWLAKKFTKGSHDRMRSVDESASPPHRMVRRPSAADSIRAEESARSSRRPSIQESTPQGRSSPSPSAALHHYPSYQSTSPGQTRASSTSVSPSISPVKATVPLPAASYAQQQPTAPDLAEMPEENEEPHLDDPVDDVVVDPDTSVQGSEGRRAEEPASNVVFTPGTVDVLSRLDSILGLASSLPAQPSQLSDPPRSLLLHSPCLQVVNNHTAKDRYLFLFTDILIIGKPILVEGEMPTLDTKFIIKSIVELPKLKLSGLRDDDGTPDMVKSQHPLVISFVQTFATDPARAVRDLIDESGLPEDSIASMLFKTIELDRTRLGEFLSSRKQSNLLQKFLVKFSFGGVRIDEALRIFLLAVRLPTEATAGERLLEAFATQWQESNASVSSFSRELSVHLVLAIMQLNDALNPNTSFGTFAFVNQAISVDDFIAAFRSHDPRRQVRDDLLEALYLSIKNEKLSQALSSTEAHLERDIYVLPTRISSRLTYRIASDPIYITIPEADPKLVIRLHGAGLSFDPPVLTFANSSRVSFRVTGVSLGPKTMLLSRIGPTASLYTALPISKSFEVMRAFMRPGHTFQLSFMREPTNTRRKYLFSFEDMDNRLRWAGTLQGQIQRSIAAKKRLDSLGPIAPRVREAAEVVSLQVLRDALLPVEPEEPQNKKAAAKALQRSASVSQVYPLRGGRIEADLDAELEREKAKAGGSKHRATSAKPTTAEAHKVVQELEAQAASKFYPAQTGRQISFQCEQNSLIPLVLSFLQQGLPQPQPTPSPLNGLGIS